MQREMCMQILPIIHCLLPVHLVIQDGDIRGQVRIQLPFANSGGRSWYIRGWHNNLRGHWLVKYLHGCEEIANRE